MPLHPSPKREQFDPSKYKQPFLDIMADYHLVMTNHHGRKSAIKSREYTVEMLYYFEKTAGTIDTPGEEEIIVLNLSHDKYGVFTKHHFQDEADKPFQYKTLKEDIDKIGVKYSSKAEKQRMSSTSQPEGVNVFHEVTKALHEMDCTEVELREIRHGVKFTGNFHGIKFMFNVYNQKDGRLNTKPKKGKQPQNPFWDKPKPPPTALERKIDGVITWVKDAEAGRLSSSSEIAASPSGSEGINDLAIGMASLNV